MLVAEKDVVKVVKSGGPFGGYSGRCMGVILNQLVEHERIPLSRVEAANVGFHGDGGTLINGVVGKFKWLGNTDIPVFYFENAAYREPSAAHTARGLAPRFRLQLDERSEQPVLRVTGRMLTESLYEYLKSIMYDERVSCVIESNVIAVELMLPDSIDAHAFVQEINDTFIYKDLEGG